jgi:hypothetical protein
VPELEGAIANMPRVRVKERNVAVAIRLARLGTTVPEDIPHMPAAWKALAESTTDIDQVIDTVWPQ